MRILVVDDDAAVREAIDRALRLDGYRTELAADGRAALNAIAVAPPDAVVLDPARHHVHRGGREIELTRTEFALLELFMRNPDRVMPRSLIYERVWGYDFGPSSNSLDVYVGYLRRKTEAEGETRLIHNVRGVGFVLRR